MTDGPRVHHLVAEMRAYQPSRRSCRGNHREPNRARVRLRPVPGDSHHRLGVEPEDEVLRVSSVRRTSGSPLDSVTAWVPAEFAAPIPDRPGHGPALPARLREDSS